jgi:hypothetical protein
VAIERDTGGVTGPSPAGAGEQAVRRVLVFAIVTLAMLMGSVDSTIVATALLTSAV